MAVVLLLTLLLPLALGYGVVRPDTGRADPIVPYYSNAGLNDVNYLFYFFLDSGLTSGNYIKIEFPN